MARQAESIQTRPLPYGSPCSGGGESGRQRRVPCDRRTVPPVGGRVQTGCMCGRFANDAKIDELIQEFVAEGNDYRDWRPQYSIAPTELVPIVRERQQKQTGEITRSIDAAVWNFHPSFMKDSKRPQFNTRIETVATNGLWKGAFASSRCLVPMRGYYEWTGEPGHKQAFFLHGERPLLAAAGIYTTRKVGDEWEVSTSIITREARDASGEVHDRMPVFLERDVWNEYLAPVKLDDDGRAEMVALLTSESERVASTISHYEVDRRVNNSRAVDPADPTLIEPID
ncbi:SOS response-associated peptidase [Agromyces badenianii]|nr:SOS response-associated peptidase [Agromyces badenianii]